MSCSGKEELFFASEYSFFPKIEYPEEFLASDPDYTRANGFENSSDCGPLDPDWDYLGHNNTLYSCAAYAPLADYEGLFNRYINSDVNDASTEFTPFEQFLVADFVSGSRVPTRRSNESVQAELSLILQPVNRLENAAFTFQPEAQAGLTVPKFSRLNGVKRVADSANSKAYRRAKKRLGISRPTSWSSNVQHGQTTTPVPCHTKSACSDGSTPLKLPRTPHLPPPANLGSSTTSLFCEPNKVWSSSVSPCFSSVKLEAFSPNTSLCLSPNVKLLGLQRKRKSEDLDSFVSKKRKRPSKAPAQSVKIEENNSLVKCEVPEEPCNVTGESHVNDILEFTEDRHAVLHRVRALEEELALARLLLENYNAKMHVLTLMMGEVSLLILSCELNRDLVWDRLRSVSSEYEQVQRSCANVYSKIELLWSKICEETYRYCELPPVPWSQPLFSNCSEIQPNLDDFARPQYSENNGPFSQPNENQYAPLHQANDQYLAPSAGQFIKPQDAIYESPSSICRVKRSQQRCSGTRKPSWSKRKCSVSSHGSAIIGSYRVTKPKNKRKSKRLFDYAGAQVLQELNSSLKLQNVARNPEANESWRKQLVLLYDQQLCEIKRTQLKRGSLDTILEMHQNVLYETNAGFGPDKPYQQEFTRTELDPITKEPLMYTRSGLCAFCDDLHFYELKNSCYSQHLCHLHGIYPDNFLTPDPLHIGKYLVTKGGSPKRKTKPRKRPHDCVVCPGCYELVEIRCWESTLGKNPFANYLRHFKEKHRVNKYLESYFTMQS